MALFGPGDVVYLYLPMAHVFAQLIHADCVEVGATVAYWGGDTTQIVPELGQIHPTVLPSVPRIFEKVYSLAMSMVPPEKADEVAQAIQLGLTVRAADRAGEPVADALRAAFDAVDAEMFALVRGIFGGKVQLAISGAAPIAKEILEFFYAAGVPVFEGWGMTETTSIGTLNLPDAFRFGTIGKAVAGADIRIAEDGEIEMAGPMLLQCYWNNPEATADTHDRRRLPAHRRPRLDRRGRLRHHHRPQEGHHHHRRRQEPDAGQHRGRPASFAVDQPGRDVRRPQAVSGGADHARRRDDRAVGASRTGCRTDLDELAESDEVRALIQADLDAANANYAQVGQIKKFKILGRDFSLEEGELTPSLKLKRNVVYDRFADDFEVALPEVVVSRGSTRRSSTRWRPGR